MDTWAYFRFTSLSVLLGFAFFCLSYATWVWRRRQAKSPATGVITQLRSWSRALLLGGVALAMITFIIAEVVPIRGVMRLDESFAARARAETELKFLAAEGLIHKGELLAQFAPTNQQAEIASLQAKHDKLAADLEKTEAMPLEIDEELTRAHQNALTQIEQAQAALNNFIPLLKETLRIGLEKRLERIDKYVAIDRSTIEFESTRKQFESEYEFRYKEFERVAKLSEREGVITPSEYEAKRLDAARLAEQIKKMELSLKQFERESEHLKANTLAFDELIKQQAESMAREIRLIESQKQAAQERLALAEQNIAIDRIRAQKQRDAELRMVTAEMAEIQANIRSLQESQILLAPFDGQVVYRSAAPNSINEHGVLLIMARTATAQIQFSVPTRQVRDIEQARKMDIWVQDSALASRVSGTVQKVEDSPVHAEQKIVSVACHPPMDILPELAEKQLVPIQLTWSPPLLSIPLFQGACGLALLGLFGCVVTWNTSKNTDESETVTFPAAGVSSAPTVAFAGAPGHGQLGLHHGSAGANLQLLGSKFREALFARAVDHDLLASLEWALDRHQSRGVKMLRSGFVGVMTEQEDLHEQVQNSLNALVDEHLISSENYDRLMAILNTLDYQATTAGHRNKFAG